MNAELAALQTKFSQNVLKEKNAESIVVDDREGTGRHVRNEISRGGSAAKEAKKEGKFVIALQNTTRPTGPHLAQEPRPARENHENFARAQQSRRRIGQSRSRDAHRATARRTRRSARLRESRRLPTGRSNRQERSTTVNKSSPSSLRPPWPTRTRKRPTCRR